MCEIDFGTHVTHVSQEAKLTKTRGRSDSSLREPHYDSPDVQPNSPDDQPPSDNTNVPPPMDDPKSGKEPGEKRQRRVREKTVRGE